MSRQSWKKVLLGTAVVLLLLTAVGSANACWWGCCRPVYYGCSSCYSAWDYCGGWYGGYSRPYRWGCGWCGGYYSSRYNGCYSGCYATYSCCNAVAATCCGSTTTTAAPAAPTMPTPAKKPVMEAPAPTPAVPATPPEPSPTPALPGTTTEPAPAMPGTTPAVPPTEPSTMSSPTPETSGVVTVWVPYDAKVTINGLATRSIGSRRQFVSYGLKPGFSYKYDIHAETVREGKLVEETHTVALTAGENTAVAFGFNTKPAEAVASAN